MPKKITYYFFIFIILVLISVVDFGIYSPSSQNPVNNQFSESKEEQNTAKINTRPSIVETYLVTRVIDGDTIVVLIEGKEKTVRYIGIDTPETTSSSKPIECFGPEATAKNKELVLGKMVKLVRDVSETDSYKRLLRYVYVDDEFINLKLVQGGFANAISYPPDIKYNELFKQAEREARTNKVGLWGEKCN